MNKKRSVSDNREVYSPLRILEYALAAYNEPFILESDRLPHASFITTGYLGAFRINEVLTLLKSQFKRRLSLEKKEFMVIENADIEKSERMRNIAIPLNDPLARPVLNMLNRLDDGRLFNFTDRTGRRILSRISEGNAWQEFPHFLLRAQRNRFLSQAFSPEEREKIIGWERSEGKGKFRRTVDIYSSLNWMWYADRLAKLTENYWETEIIPPHVQEWLDSLGGSSPIMDSSSSS